MNSKGIPLTALALTLPLAGAEAAIIITNTALSPGDAPYGLVSRSDLVPGAWETVTYAPSLNGTQNEVVLSASSARHFFRLKQAGIVTKTLAHSRSSTSKTI